MMKNLVSLFALAISAVAADNPRFSDVFVSGKSERG